MGGHAAWRKRVAAGGLAKGSGGAALRHRPRLGRRGADLALNRLGNLGGHGNPKKRRKLCCETVDTKSARSALTLQQRVTLLCGPVVLIASTMLSSIMVVFGAAGIFIAWNADHLE